MTAKVIVLMVLGVYVRLTDMARSERGQDMVEYALISTFLAAAIVLVTVGLLSPSFTTWANAVASCIAGLGSCGF